MKKLFLIAFFLGTLSASAQVYKLEVRDNYFEVVDTTKSSIVFIQPINDLKFSIASGDTSVVFFDLSGIRVSPRTVTFHVSNTVDKDSLAFASFADLKDFCFRNTGGGILYDNVVQNFTADSTTTGFAARGLYTAVFQGTFGSGNVGIEYSWDNSTWLDLTATFTSDTVITFETAGFVRVVLTSSTSPNLNVSINKIR